LALENQERPDGRKHDADAAGYHPRRHERVARGGRHWRLLRRRPLERCPTLGTKARLGRRLGAAGLAYSTKCLAALVAKPPKRLGAAVRTTDRARRHSVNLSPPTYGVYQMGAV
jgi:hypothetical protein